MAHLVFRQELDERVRPPERTVHRSPVRAQQGVEDRLVIGPQLGLIVATLGGVSRLPLVRRVA
ncbi:MAG: hypothetical protein ACR2K2_15325 [Mycobacteriales bacterium]